MTTKTEDVYLTSLEAAKILNISPRTLIRWRDKRMITSYRIGNNTVYDAREVKALLKQRTTPTLITTEESK